MQQDGVGQNRIDGTAKLPAPNVENSSRVPGVLQALDEPDACVGPIDGQTALLQIPRFPARTASQFKNEAPWDLRHHSIE